MSSGRIPPSKLALTPLPQADLQLTVLPRLVSNLKQSVYLSLLNAGIQGWATMPGSMLILTITQMISVGGTVSSFPGLLSSCPLSFSSVMVLGSVGFPFRVHPESDRFPTPQCILPGLQGQLSDWQLSTWLSSVFVYPEFIVRSWHPCSEPYTDLSQNESYKALPESSQFSSCPVPLSAPPHWLVRYDVGSLGQFPLCLQASGFTFRYRSRVTSLAGHMVPLSHLLFYILSFDSSSPCHLRYLLSILY